MLIDTHCHIHEADYPLDPEVALQNAHDAGVDQLICVGTSEASSRAALAFADMHDNVFAAIGVHPHDTKDGWGEIGDLLANSKPGHSPLSALKQANLRRGNSADTSLYPAELANAQTSSDSTEVTAELPGQFDGVSSSDSGEWTAGVIPQSSRSFAKSLETPAARESSDVGARIDSRREAVSKDFGGCEGEQENKVGQHSKLVAIGEIGLDYFYTHSPREVQIEALQAQIQLALDRDLPIIFHVREAFADFWPIFDNFHGIRGELHSFTDNEMNLHEALKRGLCIGVNGISTFTKDEVQQQMFTQIPLEKMLLETDAPFLTPAPFRGRVNEPAFVRQVAEFHANSRGVSVEELGRQTSANARALFAL